MTQPVHTDAVGLALVGRVLRRRWRVLAVCAVAGALAGAAASPLLSPGYETSASVLLQGPRAADELRTEAQVAASSVVLDRAAAGLGGGVTGADLARTVEAAVADGNIIEITAVASDAEAAQARADRVAQEYVTFSTQLLGDTEDPSARVSQDQQENLRQQVTQTMRRISELHDSAGRGDTIDSVGVRTGLESLRTALAQAITKLDELDAATGRAKMVVMGPAQRPAAPAAPTMVHLGAGGALAALVLGLFGHLLASRLDRRVRPEPEIAGALGTTVLGSVDEPAMPEDHPAPGALRRLLGLGAPPWHAPDLAEAAAGQDLDVRHRRVLGRLGAARGVSAVVPADDRAAVRAARRLAGASGGRVRVVEVTAHRPTVPDDPGGAGVLVVLTAGTRTAWELVGLAQACADAGQDVLGVVVVTPTVPARPEPVVPAGAVLAGSP